MNPCRLFLVCALVGLAIPALLAQQNESPVDWVRRHAIRLATAEPGHDFADLQPLVVPKRAFDALLFVDTTTAARKNPGR